MDWIRLVVTCELVFKLCSAELSCDFQGFCEYILFIIDLTIILIVFYFVLSSASVTIVVYVFLDAATLTEILPCFFLGCKANARV